MITDAGKMRGLKKDTVEETRSLDILGMQRAGVFSQQQGKMWTSTWYRGDDVMASIGYTFEGNESNGFVLRLNYTHTDGNGEVSSRNYPVSLDSTPCHFGGRRWWFICMLLADGTPCGRRCRILYMPYGTSYFGCRECYDLTYQSRQMHRNSVYEGLIKPYTALQEVKRNMPSARSQKAVEKLDRKADAATLAYRSYARKHPSR